MSKIEIKAFIDADNPVQVAAACIFLQSLNPEATINPTPVALDKRGTDKRGTAKKTKVETPEVETPEVETPEVETPEVETPEVETPEVETPEVHADILRGLVKEKCDPNKETSLENRNAIKAKLKLLEAPNITKLDVKNYKEFYDFLNKLN
jgi:hypothetical protein